jgi:hypothetical protein
MLAERLMGSHTNMNSEDRLIMQHVGGINGFIPNAQLIYKAGLATGDYHECNKF